MKYKTNLVFWIFLVVVYGFIYSHEREQIQDTKYQALYQRGNVWNFQRGKRCSLLMVNAGKWGGKIKWGRCQLAIAQLLCVASLVFPFFSVIKILYHEHPFAFSPALSVMPYSQEHRPILRWPYLRLHQSAYRGWLSIMTSSEAPLFSLASGPPTLNPPLINSIATQQ